MFIVQKQIDFFFPKQFSFIKLLKLSQTKASLQKIQQHKQQYPWWKPILFK